VYLAQNEVDYLMALEKILINSPTVILGNTPLKYSHQLISTDGRERFYLDIFRASLNLQKYTLQERSRKIIILVRVDMAGAPHTNPDGTRIECPHIHLYKEGYGDKWAFSLDEYPFRNPTDIVTTFEDFLQFCNIIELPEIQRSLV